MKAITFLFLLFTIVACNKPAEYIDPEWDKLFPIENQAFSLRFPTQDWKLVPLQGIDSYVGYFERGSDKIYLTTVGIMAILTKTVIPNRFRMKRPLLMAKER